MFTIFFLPPESPDNQYHLFKCEPPRECKFKYPLCLFVVFSVKYEPGTIVMHDQGIKVRRFEFLAEHISGQK